MINDATNMVIVHSATGYGNVEVYRASLAKAKEIFDSYPVHPSLQEVADKLLNPDRPVYRELSLLKKSLMQVLTLNQDPQYHGYLEILLRPGATLDGSKAEPLEVTEQMQKELQLWLLANNQDTRSITSETLSLIEKGTISVASLEFLKPLYQRSARSKAHGVAFMDAELLSTGDTLRMLQKNKWKEGSSECRVINTYLAFVSEHLAPRSVSYHLCSITE